MATVFVYHRHHVHLKVLPRGGETVVTGLDGGGGFQLSVPEPFQPSTGGRDPFLRTPSRPSLASWPKVGEEPRAVTGQVQATYTSPLDGISQEPHNVVAFCSPRP